MYGRYIGHYTVVSLIHYLFPKTDVESSINLTLPDGNKYYFAYAREAIYAALIDIKDNCKYNSSKSNCIAIPGWGCPIVMASVAKAGFTPLLFDVSAQTLQMDIDEIIKNKTKYNIKAVILVAENGIFYDNTQIEKLKNEGIRVIADFAVAWQNYPMFSSKIYSDYAIFSGGFSKPVSGTGLGILVTKSSRNYKKNDRSHFAAGLFKIVIHLFLQNQFIYKILQSFIPKDLQTEYDGKLHSPSLRSLAVVSLSLKERQKYRNEWLSLQSEVLKLLKQKGSISPSLKYFEVEQNKILVERNLIKQSANQIEFHKQYSYDLLTDKRSILASESMQGIKQIQNDFVSFSLNISILKSKTNFLKALGESLI